jgi:oligoendopeptidase F
MTTKGGGKGSEMKIEVSREETWDLEAIFQDVGSWQREFDAVKAEIAPLGQYSGRLLESAGTLGEFLQRSDSTGERIHRLHS